MGIGTTAVWVLTSPPRTQAPPLLPETLQKTVAAHAFQSSAKAEFDHQKQPKKPEINLPKPLSGPSQATQKAIRDVFQVF